MPYAFQYVPTSGDLSGKAFEEQTARAFNELGAGIDEVTASAGEAVSLAQNAQATAQNALQTADAANSAAQEAKDIAQNAQVTSDDALAMAEQARTTAQSALSQAAGATTTADNAVGSAVAANALAASAAETAEAAKHTAEIAAGEAINATTMAETATGIFFVDNTVRDANDSYTSAKKAFFTNTSTETPNLNFPPDLPPPYWFMVYVTDDGRAATQTCWNNNSSLVYMRTATINDSDQDNPAATWGEWVEFGGGGGGGGVPSGVITMWSGAVTAIPTGWLLCDGENGTPDLRDRFLVGAGNTYAAGDTGGADAVTPTGTVANTTLTIAQMPSHGHTYTATGVGTGAGLGTTSSPYPIVSNTANTGAAGGGGAHDHGLTLDAIDTRPPYYALAFIMKS